MATYDNFGNLESFVNLEYSLNNQKTFQTVLKALLATRNFLATGWNQVVKKLSRQSENVKTGLKTSKPVCKLSSQFVEFPDCLEKNAKVFFTLPPLLY